MSQLSQQWTGWTVWAAVLLLSVSLVASTPEVGIHQLKTLYGSEVVQIDGDGDARKVTMRNGTVIPWSDGRRKSPAQTIAEPDLEDHFRCRYSAGSSISTPLLDADPGRARNEAFLRAVYGKDEAAVKKNLVQVIWMPAHRNLAIPFNKKMGAASALEKVGAELDRLPIRFQKYLKQKPGTFKWRKIAGTERLSAHSFGIAIDVAVSHSDYWRWQKPLQQPIVYRNRIPHAVVEVFEAHGFIWGGRWYHFDTMHFEYRPECLQH